MSAEKKKETSKPSKTHLAYHLFITYILPYLLLLHILRHLFLQYDVFSTFYGVFSTSRRNTKVFVASAVLFLGLLLLLLLKNRRSTMYLVDFSCYKPDSTFMRSCEAFVERSVELGTFTAENVQFQKKILERSGLGDSTYFPKAVASLPPDLRIFQARKEAELVVYGAVDDLLARNPGINVARDIGVVVVNCSLFCPTPSMAEMVVNRYGLREDVDCYHLSGMGCSAGLIAIDLVDQLLKVHHNTCALVVSTENLTLHGYYGNNRSMLVTNCLFRMGGAAVLLSNRRSDRRAARYRLSHLVRTHRGAHLASYSCVMQGEDDDGHVGIALSKDLMSVAGDALRSNIASLGPRVLPFSEQLLFAAAFIANKMLPKSSSVKPYVPDFKLAFEHFCIHAGGRAILDELEKRLKLSDWHMEPSRMSLYRFGNTSSSSLWYELAYSEAKGRIKKGHRVWQIGFGSGFKCNSAVWTAIRDVKPDKNKLPWLKDIDNLPVNVPKVNPISI